MNSAFADLYHRLVPWIGEHTGIDRETIIAVIAAQEKFWDCYGPAITKAMEDEEPREE